jgi:hypothetical protein
MPPKSSRPRLLSFVGVIRGETQCLLKIASVGQYILTKAIKGAAVFGIERSAAKDLTGYLQNLPISNEL